MSTFLIRSAASPSNSYPIVLTRLGEPRSRPNPIIINTDNVNYERAQENTISAVIVIISMIIVVIKNGMIVQQRS